MRQRVGTTCICLLTALLVQGWDLRAARAAVRVCHPLVSGEIVEGASEREAKAGAIAQWRAKAAEHGKGYDAWRLAAQKALKCFSKADQVACIALGQPCVILQNPQRLPDVKDRKGQSL